MSDRMKRIREFAEEQRQFDIEVGRELERERIIALLETRLDEFYERNDMGGWSFEPKLLIALIKGENE